MKFICPRCVYGTYKFNYMIRHLKKKKACPTTVLSTPRNEIINSLLEDREKVCKKNLTLRELIEYQNAEFLTLISKNKDINEINCINKECEQRIKKYEEIEKKNKVLQEYIDILNKNNKELQELVDSMDKKTSIIKLEKDTEQLKEDYNELKKKHNQLKETYELSRKYSKQLELRINYLEKEHNEL